MESGKPTNKPRRRYILFKLKTTSPLTRRDILELLKESTDSQPLTQKSSIAMRLTLYDPEKKMGILRCDHRNVDEVRKLLNALRYTELEIQTLRTSGTIKTLKEKFHLKQGRQDRIRDIRKGFRARHNDNLSNEGPFPNSGVIK